MNLWRSGKFFVNLVKWNWLIPNEIRHQSIVLFFNVCSIWYCILSFRNFYPLLFLWFLKCSKKNLRKWTWKQEKKTKIFVLQPILDCFTILKSFEKCIFKKLINSSFNRLIDFLWIFRRFSWFLLGKVVSPKLKIKFFWCSILIVQTMLCWTFQWISHN
jgi:hypothetical protein